jgi:hypothetical protein
VIKAVGDGFYESYDFMTVSTNVFFSFSQSKLSVNYHLPSWDTTWLSWKWLPDVDLSNKGYSRLSNRLILLIKFIVVQMCLYLLYTLYRNKAYLCHRTTKQFEFKLDLIHFLYLTECQESTFGKNCTGTCHCADEKCNHISGSCTFGGCANNYSGSDCQSMYTTYITNKTLG